ncbi:MAG TPA: hypothetical protein VHV78_16740, partial [Gemmatimonadaceae bacterium]|nr:hypothetical protein [Gemmatimonadaceae bacterium]
VRLTILTSTEFLERYRAMLFVAPNITVAESPSDGPAFIDRIRSAAALLLPVNFDRDSVTFIRYSMPTKVPAYLASGTPILAYGPLDVAQIGYARHEQWAHVVSEPDPARLCDAMRRILDDTPLRDRLSSRALALAPERHDLGQMRSRFQAAISALG